MIIVYTTGVFDLLHPGHLNLLSRARALGDKLVVGIQEDESVEAQKGEKPIMSCQERMAMLQALPFVDVVLSYSNVDQREMLAIIKPDIMVQGGDWLKTGNRSKIIHFLEKKHIRLVQFPYTHGISTTAIKEKIYQDLDHTKKEKIHFDLKENLQLIPLENLLLYEKNDPNRTEKIVQSILRTGYFINPITVGDIGQKDKFLVIDGTNRTQALKELKAKYILAQVVDYLDDASLNLKSNEHYLNVSSANFWSAIKNIKFKTIDQETCSTWDKLLALVITGKKKYGLEATSNLVKDLTLLNQLVQGYKNQTIIYRKSEVGDLIEQSKIVIKFKTFTPSDIVEIANRQLFLESGITWHLIENQIIHFKMPFDLLKRRFRNKLEAEKFLKKMIEQKSKQMAIRRYLTNVYLCDEWE